MKNQSYKLFGMLCEQIILNEASSIVPFITNVPNHKEFVKLVHTVLDIPHDFKFEKVPKIELGKDTTIPGAGGMGGSRTYVLVGEKETDRVGRGIAFQLGAAALIYNNNRREYDLLVPASPSLQGTEYEHEIVSRIGNFYEFRNITSGKRALAILKLSIGNIKQIYAGGGSNKKTQELRSKRISRKATPRFGSHTLLKKFSPIFKKMLVSAEQEYKGMLNIMIKNGSYKNISEKIEKLKKIKSMINAIDTYETGKEAIRRDSGIQSSLERLITNALVLAARYYYPNETSELVRSHEGYTSNSSKGIDMILDDIKNGDSAKLSTVLAYFKNGVLYKP